MKRLFLLCAALVAVAMAAPARAAAPLSGDGFLELREGGIVQAYMFKRNYNDTCDLARSYVTGWISKDVLQQNSDLLAVVSAIEEQNVESARIKILFDDLEKILLVDERALYSPYLPKTASDIVVTAVVPGKAADEPATRLEIGLKDAWFTDCFGEFAYVEVDDLLHQNKHVTQRISIKDVASVNFGMLGQLKWNPATGRYFPQNYLFDPYDGSRLQWFSLPAEGLAAAKEIPPAAAPVK